MAIDIVDPWFRTYRELGDVTIVGVDLTQNKEREAYAVTWLDENEQQRSNRFLFERPRREYTLCRAALRVGLCSRLGCNNSQLAFGTSKYGKPFGLVDGIVAPIPFNVSHSGKYGLIAYARQGRLGVDVEERNTRINLNDLSEAVFSPDEQADYALARGNEKIHLFFTLWTLKEAMIKALGLGFAQDPSEFQIPSKMRRGETTSIFEFPGMPNTRWKLENLSNSEFAAAVVHELVPATEDSSDSAFSHRRMIE